MFNFFKYLGEIRDNVENTEEPEIQPNTVDNENINTYERYVSEIEIESRKLQSSLLIILFIASILIITITIVIIFLFYILNLNRYLPRTIHLTHLTVIQTIYSVLSILGLSSTILFIALNQYFIGSFVQAKIKHLMILKSSLREIRKREEEEEKLRRAREEEEENRKEFDEPKTRIYKLYLEYKEVTEKAGRVFFESDERQELAKKLRKDIGSKLESSKKDQTINPEILSDIQYSISSLKEILDREVRDQKGQTKWQSFNIILIIIYIAIIAGFIVYTAIYNPSLKQVIVPYIYMPIWVLIWGALGSLSAILYKFYNVKNRVKLSIEVQWLIARPIIGILMSTVAYLAVTSGLVFLGAEDLNTSDIESLRNNLNGNTTRFTSLVCFLAGFSDRVYLGIIDLLVSRLGLEQNNKKKKVKPRKKTS